MNASIKDNDDGSNGLYGVTSSTKKEQKKFIINIKVETIAVGDFIIFNILKQSNGTAIRINDQEMLEGVSLLSKEEGIFAAPEGGAVLIATKKLRDNGFIKDDDKVVVVNTGSAYKYLDAMQKKFWDD